jgi:hypothetical protein
LGEKEKLVWSQAFLDDSSVPAKGGEEIDLTKAGKRTKSILPTDGEGAPCSPAPNTQRENWLKPPWRGFVSHGSGDNSETSQEVGGGPSV